MGRYVVSGSISLENPRLDALVENCFDSVMITEGGKKFDRKTYPSGSGTAHIW